jgi:hypothetical protein
MVRRRESAVSNHEARDRRVSGLILRDGPSVLLRMRGMEKCSRLSEKLAIARLQ